MAKKKTTKKTTTKKLDPKEEFVVRSYTRAEIAETLNEVIENENEMNQADLKVRRFTPSDARLTKKFCERFVETMADAICQIDEVVEYEYSSQSDIVYDME